MRYVLVTEDHCLASLTARYWASKKSVEIVNKDEAASIVELYGIRKVPTLLAIGKYGVIEKVLSGFNKKEYDIIYDKESI